MRKANDIYIYPCLGKDGVVGSIPIGSTINKALIERQPFLIHSHIIPTSPTFPGISGGFSNQSSPNEVMA